MYRNTLTIFQDTTQHNLFQPAHNTYTDILTAAPKNVIDYTTKTNKRTAEAYNLVPELFV